MMIVSLSVKYFAKYCSVIKIFPYVSDHLYPPEVNNRKQKLNPYAAGS